MTNWLVITSVKEVTFYLVFVCLSVCLSVCLLETSRNNYSSDLRRENFSRDLSLNREELLKFCQSYSGRNFPKDSTTLKDRQPFFPQFGSDFLKNNRSDLHRNVCHRCILRQWITPSPLQFWKSPDSGVRVLFSQSINQSVRKCLHSDVAST